MLQCRCLDSERRCLQSRPQRRAAGVWCLITAFPHEKVGCLNTSRLDIYEWKEPNFFVQYLVPMLGWIHFPDVIKRRRQITRSIVSTAAFPCSKQAFTSVTESRVSKHFFQKTLVETPREESVPKYRPECPCVLITTAACEVC
ncbi:hypothetical protein E2C01_035391 [Portunus trituberculatus]|uniref:Uncharacterized protein n=1 Tax=Portunus trituberculatus TaxID=210409 RepID=A0A5B7F922_PORTR|nr:hypothetical protein [Portunus trituberculatus]